MKIPESLFGDRPYLLTSDPRRTSLDPTQWIITDGNQRYATNTVSSYFIRYSRLHAFPPLPMLTVLYDFDGQSALCHASAGLLQRDTASKCKTLSFARTARAAGATAVHAAGFVFFSLGCIGCQRLVAR